MTKITTTTSAERQVSPAQQHLDEILAYLKEERKDSPVGTGLLTYEPRATDIIVTTFPKAGTTFGQQLVYQTIVATGGGPVEDRDGTKFEDIGQVSPWIDYIPQMTFKYMEPSPRSYKTHATPSPFDISKQKHFVIIRDPMKFAKSWLNFTFENYPFKNVLSASVETKQLWFDYTIEGEILGSNGESGISDCGGFGSGNDVRNELNIGPWCTHTKGWIDYIDHKNVVIMFYEDMVKNLGDAVDIVAKFIGDELTVLTREQVIERCSKQHMANSTQFKAKIDAMLFGTSNLDAARVRPEGVDYFRKCTIKDEYVNQLGRQMKAAFGVESYSAFRSMVKDKQRQLGLPVVGSS